MLTLYDYAIFAFMLLFSAAIGLYYGCFGSKQSTTNEYLLGEKKLKVIPVGISIAVSHFSGVAILGISADVFRYGGTILLLSVSCALMALISIFVYHPVFFKLQLTNAYEYFAKRFDNRTKQLAVCLHMTAEIIYFPVLVYVPALVFSATSGFNIIATSFVVCAFCVFYTTIGGLKAVIWTDIFQFIVIVVCLVIVYIMGLQATGGFLSVWNTALYGQRLNVFDFDPNPMKRDSFWIILIGYTISITAGTVIHQSGVQKFLAVPKFRDSILSVICSCVGISLVLTLCGFIGLEIYARYSKCDPLTSRKISKHDQILLFFINDVAAHVPGIQGLFIATIFSAALSTMSTLLNSASAVIYKNFLTRFLKSDHSEKTRSNILKLTVLVFGTSCTCLVFIVGYFEEIVPLAMALKGSINGPLLGMFTLGMVFPRANARGTFYGGLGGLFFLAYITITAKYYQMKRLLRYPTKPLLVEGCSFSNYSSYSFLLNSTAHSSTATLSQVPILFQVSFFYYTLIGALFTIILGLMISYLSKRDTPVDQILISPLFHFLLDKRARREEDCSENRVELLQNKNLEEHQQRSLV